MLLLVLVGQHLSGSDKHGGYFKATQNDSPELDIISLFVRPFTVFLKQIGGPKSLNLVKGPALEPSCKDNVTWLSNM